MYVCVCVCMHANNLHEDVRGQHKAASSLLIICDYFFVCVMLVMSNDFLSTIHT